MVSHQKYRGTGSRTSSRGGFSLVEIAVSLGISSILALGSAATFVRLTAVDRAADTESKLTSAAVEISSAVNYNNKNCNLLTFTGGLIVNDLVVGGQGQRVSLNLGPNMIYSENANVEIGNLKIFVNRLRLENGVQRGQGDATDCAGNLLTNVPLWEADLVLTASTTGALTQQLAPMNVGRFTFVAQAGASIASAVNATVALNQVAQTCTAMGQTYDGGLGRCVFTPTTYSNSNPVSFCTPFQQGHTRVQSGAAPLPSCAPINAAAAEVCAYGTVTVEDGQAVCANPGVIVDAIPFAAAGVTPAVMAPRGPPIFGVTTVAAPTPATNFCMTPPNIVWSVNHGGTVLNCSSSGNPPRKIARNAWTGFADYNQTANSASGQINVTCDASLNLTVAGYSSGQCTESAGTLTCDGSGTEGLRSGATCVNQNFSTAFSNNSSLPAVTMAAPGTPTGNGLNQSTACRTAWQRYTACQVFNTANLITAACPTPVASGCSNSVNTPQPTASAVGPILAAPSIVPVTCQCSNTVNIGANQYCGWCMEKSFGFGLTASVFEVNQCLNGVLQRVTSAQGVVALNPKTCTGGIIVPLTAISGNRYQQ